MDDTAAHDDRRTLWLFIPAIVALAFASALLSYESSGHLDQCWDERVDRDIAEGLRDHPLVGEQPPLDASQLRLPMYVTAAAYAVTGRDDLDVARAVSAAVGGLTVVVTAGLGTCLFGRLVGMLAAALLAFSPYFLAYARIAMTEGDVFLACTMTAALWAYVAWLRRPTGGRWVAASVLLALAVGAKLYGAALVPVFWVLARTTRREKEDDSDGCRGSEGGKSFSQVRVREGILAPASGILAPAVDSEHGGGRWLFRLLSLAGVILVLSTVAAMRSKPLAIAGWSAMAAIWLVMLLLVWRRGIPTRVPTLALVAMVGFAVLTFFALMPVHLVEHRILRELIRRTLSWDHQAPLSLWSDHLRLYSGIVLIKLTVPLGIAMTAALALAAVRERVDGRWRPCLLTVVFYIVALCFLPLRQSFYLMGVYPIMVILTAAFLVEVGRFLWRRRAAAGAAWATGVAAMLVHLGVEVARGWPHYHLYGHKLVGDHWLGAESRGYRNLIQTPSDGVETLVAWCREHVRPGESVVSYLWEDHLIRRALPALGFRFTSRGISQDSDALPPPPSTAGADYVLLHINNRLGYGDRPADMPDEQEIAVFRPVFAVRRDGTEVAWVFGRREKSP